MHGEGKICRVCGSLHYDYPWGEDGSCASFEICECCGTTFGYEDATIVAIKRKRKEWIDSGAQWREPQSKPEGWSLDDALRSIPDNYK
ncbi:MAG: hypothetical protein CME70_03705 [Halobacteriovorax sp.]|nr:hypothetical protein [Halobacteriovorax sp.]|tara:strand:+ start:187439 stop:187702 length:264 start_codon:yes stop_codon:yes gene_type:complete